MNFKLLRALFRVCVPAVLAAGAARAGDPAAAFVASVFADPPAPVVVDLRGERAARAAEILGHAYPKPAATCWRANGRTAWVLEGRGKTQLFTAGFVVAAGRLVRSEVLVYRESRGREIRSPRFLARFTGAGLGPDRQLDRRIDGVTGATISVSAMKNLARLALVLDASVRDP